MGRYRTKRKVTFSPKRQAEWLEMVSQPKSEQTRMLMSLAKIGIPQTSEHVAKRIAGKVETEAKKRAALCAQIEAHPAVRMVIRFLDECGCTGMTVMREVTSPIRLVFTYNDEPMMIIVDEKKLNDDPNKWINNRVKLIHRKRDPHGKRLTINKRNSIINRLERAEPS